MNKVFSGHQPNFLPYMGVFYKMFKSDVFVLDDDVQYSKSGLHNKNKLVIGGNEKDIIVPVKYTFGDSINEVEIVKDQAWARKMLKSIQCNYKNATHFEEGYDMLERHLSKGCDKLVELSIGLIQEIAYRMGIKCSLMIASKDCPTTLKNNSRNIYQCRFFDCDTYYSGVGGKDYNDEELYEANGIKIEYSDYKPVCNNLSVLHYILTEGFELPKEWVS